MKARTAIARTAHRVRLTAAAGLMTVLACVALSACTGGGSPSASETLFTGSASGSASSTATASSTASSTASASSSASASASASASTSPSASVSPSATPSASPSPSPSYSPYPTGAPITGGGGTAGFQDGGFAVLGGAAIVAGLGSIIYRRRITRHR
jgi:hypothetical protein